MDAPKLASTHLQRQRIYGRDISQAPPMMHHCVVIIMMIVMITWYRLRNGHRTHVLDNMFTSSHHAFCFDTVRSWICCPVLRVSTYFSLSYVNLCIWDVWHGITAPITVCRTCFRVCVVLFWNVSFHCSSLHMNILDVWCLLSSVSAITRLTLMFLTLMFLSADFLNKFCIKSVAINIRSMLFLRRCCDTCIMTSYWWLWDMWYNVSYWTAIWSASECYLCLF